ncbi:MAG: adenylyltransferase/cytidyltransferase family protein [Chloroflexi bacterium]|nr:adenylyltransferase/cytidyltransferase family protein [Chloroflexota bacterium]
MNLNKIAAVSGAFDPIHSGHIHHLEDALRRATAANLPLLIILTRDDQLVARKKFFFMSFKERVDCLEWGLKGRAIIIENVDKDTTSVESLRMFKPKLYFKGGGAWSQYNLPEWAVCKELGIEVVFDVGGREKEQSSTLLAKKAAESMRQPAGQPRT